MYSKIKRKKSSQFILVTSILPNHVPTHDLALNHHLKISDVAARIRDPICTLCKEQVTTLKEKLHCTPR